MAQKVSGKLLTSESALSQKKAEILARSMAAFDRQMKTWLDTKFSEPIRRAGKRAREDHDSGVEDGDGSTAAATKSEVRNIKKRTKREPKTAAAGGGAGGTTPCFACPFYKNNPGKFQTVKTCCGPGWPDIHRVKEHIYRRHSLKYVCPRCFEQFHDNDELNKHHRSEVSCKLRKNTRDSGEIITDEQEKLLRVRAKAKDSPEERWRDMYRILFPDEKKPPSPYYVTTLPIKKEAHTTTTTTPTTPTNPAGADKAASEEEFIHFKDEAEALQCKEHLQRGFHRAVKPLLKQEIDKMFNLVENVMAQKAVEISHVVMTKMIRTWQFGSQQRRINNRSPSPAASPSPSPSPRGGDGGLYTGSVGVGVPVMVGKQEEVEYQQTETGPVDVGFDQLLQDMPGGVVNGLFCENGGFDFEEFLAEAPLLGECDGSFVGVTETGAEDSAYYSNESTGTGVGGVGVGVGVGVGEWCRY